MTAPDFMGDLAARLKKDSRLDSEIVSLTVERLLKPARERNVAEVLAVQVENIALKRAKKAPK